MPSMSWRHFSENLMERGLCVRKTPLTSFLEELIEKSPRGTLFKADRIIGTILSQHPQRIERIRDQVIALGLRALIRNNCRAKTSTTSNGPDMFGHYKVPTRLSVPYHDEEVRLPWDRMPRGEFSKGSKGPERDCEKDRAVS